MACLTFLTVTEEAAYQRTVTRLNTMWNDNDPLARYAY
ncbi:hypothetical protein IW245_000707 [Longispora fulva]|uniref:Uncharacterized protein n=1 Tax=Longispora fulva TaxID=619741 RepID=A0A8J7GEU5_9ACTN|nr:hypothetical protein [Longispora fulva]